MSQINCHKKKAELLTGSKVPIACQQVLTALRNNWTILNLKKGHIQQNAKGTISGKILFYLQNLSVFTIKHSRNDCGKMCNVTFS
jgi:hypothetical protein